MIRVPSENDLLQCPYEKSHRILRFRMQVHLVRCAKVHPNAKMVRCPFNSTHLLNSTSELQAHVLKCPERKLFESFRHVEMPLGLDASALNSQQEFEEESQWSGAKYMESEKKPNKPVPPVFESLVSEENWDDEPDAPAYDPTAAAMKKNVLRMKQGAPPSEKKMFRQMERLRLAEIKNSNEANENAARGKQNM